MRSLLAAAFVVCAYPAFAETWPEHVIKPEWQELIDGWNARYISEGHDVDAHFPRGRTFVAGEDNFRQWENTTWREHQRVKFDDAGLPLQLFGEDWHYNPVQMSNFAMSQWGAPDRKDLFMTAADKLLSMQAVDGSFPLTYTMRHYTQRYSYRAGWIDGMSPGMALSVYARALLHTGEDRWQEAGDQVTAWLDVPFPEGAKGNLGDLHPSLAHYPFWLEYPTDPHVFTLNGFMFTLLGLFEWADIGQSAQARELFDAGMETLVGILPYYDMGSFSSYDLSYITYGRLWFLEPQPPHAGINYHMVHIVQLRALHSITGIEELETVADRWASYVQ